MNKLKVLVFDDSELHRKSAQKVLGDHDLVVVGDYDAAESAIESASNSGHVFDVVLTDLLVPASRKCQGSTGRKFVGQEMPLGTTIALFAICTGVKKVAVVTDMNHHDHPASAAFDCFRHINCRAEGVKVVCTNDVGSVAMDKETGEVVSREFLDSDAGLMKYPFPEGQNWGDRAGLEFGKNWKYALEKLTDEYVGW